jgi:hypothetical protein
MLEIKTNHQVEVQKIEVGNPLLVKSFVWTMKSSRVEYDWMDRVWIRPLWCWI